MLNLDPAKLLVIFVIALMVLGPERLPKVARQMAGLWKEITRVRDQVGDEVRKALPDVTIPTIPRIPSASGAIASLFNEPSSNNGSGASTRPSRPFAPNDSEESDRTSVPASLPDLSIAPDDPAMN